MHFILKLLALILMLAMLAILVPDSALLPSAFGEAPSPTVKPVALEEDVVPLPLKGYGPYAPHRDCYAADGAGYHDSTLDIQVHTIRAFETTITVVYVQVADASQLRTEQAKPYPSRTTVRTDVMAKRANAVLAINADYFVYHASGVIYRQGKLLRDRANAEYDQLAIDDQGDFHIASEGSDFLALEQPVINSFCFGPALVVDGVKQPINTRKNFAPEKKTQRIGIAQVGKLTYMVVATEGPDERNSTGLTMEEFAQLMSDLGAGTAYNLDGGASTTVIFNGTKINAQKALRIRAVSDIIYFATAEE